MLKPGQQREISRLDTTAMDVMGWDVVNPGQLDWQKLYNNALDNANDALVADREKDVEKMIKESERYNGRTDRRSASWQVGLWQQIKFQTLNMEVDNFLQTEANTAQVLFDNYMFQFDRGIAVQNETDEIDTESTVKNEFKVEETVVQLIENSQIADSESSTLNLERLGQLLSELEDVLDADGELLAMSIG